ncbi:MAG: tetratricopeptide repeat protein [Gemmatimonadota bacterium]
MATPFLTSEEYDEHAHRLYDEGDYDGALRTLQDGLGLYPHSVELYVGLGYTRLAREEFAWAKLAFETALVLDPDNEEATLGLAETLPLFGRDDQAFVLYQRLRRRTAGDDPELLLAMGRARYRDGRFKDARDLFLAAVDSWPDLADALAGLGYTLHRLDDDRGAVRALRRALQADPDHHEARVFLAHLLHDHGDARAALRHLEQIPPHEHWDPLAIWRVIDLKRGLEARAAHDPVLAVWEARLRELEAAPDPIDRLLSEVEARVGGGSIAFPGARRPPTGHEHRIHTPDGEVYMGTWQEIVRRLRDASGRSDESVADYMRRRAQEAAAERGVTIPWHDPEAFIRASARTGLLKLEY